MSGLAAGSYVVGVGLSDAPSAKFPFLPVFHPGVADQASAKPVEIGTETVYLPAIRMRAPVPLVSIVGEIVCRDGTRPAIRVPHRRATAGAGTCSATGSTGRASRRMAGLPFGSSAATATPVRAEVIVKEPMPEGGYRSYDADERRRWRSIPTRRRRSWCSDRSWRSARSLTA